MVSFIENCHFIDIHVHSSFRDEKRPYASGTCTLKMLY